MPFDPPSSPPPTVGKPYEYEGRLYEFDGTVWRSKTNGVENFYWVIALSDLETPLTVGIKEAFPVERAFTLTALPRITLFNGPAGSAFTVRISKNGDDIFEFANPLLIEAGRTRSATSTPQAVYVSGAPSFVAGDNISFTVIQVGSTLAGTGLKAHLRGRWDE